MKLSQILREIEKCRVREKALLELHAVRLRVAQLEPGQRLESLVILSKVVSRIRGVSLDALKCKQRTQPLSDARFVFYHLARKHTRLTLGQIGAELGFNDHGTVLHGCQRAVQLIEVDPTFRQFVAKAEAAFLAALDNPAPTETKSES